MPRRRRYARADRRRLGARAGRRHRPHPGHQTPAYLEENAAAADVALSPEDLARIEAELPAVAGERYDEAGMSAVDL